MDNKIEVCGIRLDNLTIAQMLQRIQESFGNGRMFAVEYVYSELLRSAVEEEDIRAIIEMADMTVIGEKNVMEVFEEVAMTTEEIEGFEFTKQVLKLLENNRKTVYWLGESEQDYEVFRAYADRWVPELTIVGAFVTDLNESGSEEIVNDINRLMPDAVIARLAFPYQEKFFEKNRPMMNTQLWLGMGSKMKLSSQNVTATSKIKSMIDKTILRRLAANQKKLEEEV